MSNEKLGAEQGRDASFKAFSDYVKKLCAILDEEGIETEQIDCDLHNLAENLLVKQMLGTLIAQPRTEQAYHARGAGQPQDERLAAIIEKHVGYFNGWHVELDTMRRNCLEAAREFLGEPGADTGTTPPPEECYVAWCRYKDNRIFLCDSDAPKAFKVYRWATLAEPQVSVGSVARPAGLITPAPTDQISAAGDTSLAGAKMSERHGIAKEDLTRWEALARNIASELAIGDDAQVLTIIETGLAQAYWAERGTTPPEGLREDLQIRRNRAKEWAAGYQERTGDGPGKPMYIHAWMCGYFNKPMASSFGLEAEIIKQFEVAATQRAPVEQGRRLTKQQREELISAAHTLGDFTIDTDHRAQELILLVESYMATAPDHAREVALRTLVSHWKAESKRIRTLADRERSQRGQESLMAQSVRYWGCAAELERALADGKEGGE